MKGKYNTLGSNNQRKKGLVHLCTNPFSKTNVWIVLNYIRNGTINSATTFRILIMGFTAGPAVSL